MSILRNLKMNTLSDYDIERACHLFPNMKLKPCVTVGSAKLFQPLCGQFQRFRTLKFNQTSYSIGDYIRTVGGSFGRIKFIQIVRGKVQIHVDTVLASSLFEYIRSMYTNDPYLSSIEPLIKQYCDEHFSISPVNSDQSALVQPKAQPRHA